MSSVKDIYRQGRTEFDATAFQDYAVRYVIPYTALASGVYRVPVPKDSWVLGVRLRIAAAFTGATSVKVGDGSENNDDGYIEVGDIDPTTLNGVIDSRGLASEAADGVATLNTFALGGKYYTDPGFILVTFATSTAISAGSLVLEVIYDGYQAALRDELVNQ